jgi:hypothetical protein
MMPQLAVFLQYEDFFKGQYIWNTYICMFPYYAVKPQRSPCSDTSLYSCDVVTYDKARMEVLTAMKLTVHMFWIVTLCHWVFCNMWKECSAFIFRVKLCKALQSFRLLGAAQWHSITSQKTWIWIFTYVEKTENLGNLGVQNLSGSVYGTTWCRSGTLWCGFPIPVIWYILITWGHLLYT